MFEDVPDTGVLNASFEVLTINGEERATPSNIPYWVEPGFGSSVQPNSNLKVEVWLRVLVQEVLTETNVKNFEWRATIDWGTGTNDSLFGLAINDQRIPTTARSVVFWDNGAEQVKEKDLTFGTGTYPLFSVTGLEDEPPPNTLTFDGLAKRFFFNEGEDATIAAFDSFGGNKSSIGGDFSSNPTFHDIIRELLYVDDSDDEPKPRKRNYVGALFDELPFGVSGRVNDFTFDVDYNSIYVVGRDVWLSDVRLIKTSYLRPGVPQHVTVSGERSQAVEIDIWSRDLFTIEEDGRFLRRRDPSDLSLQDEHDFGSTANVWGLDLDESQREIYLSTGHGTGIRKTSYSLDGNFETVVSVGSARHPLVLDDREGGLAPNFGFLDYSFDLEDASVTVEAKSLSGLQAVELRRSPTRNGSRVGTGKQNPGNGPVFDLSFGAVDYGEIAFAQVRGLGAFQRVIETNSNYPVWRGYTSGFSTDLVWDDPAQDYSSYSDKEQGSGQILADISAADEGILMEMGGGVSGLAVWVDQSSLYFAAGNGSKTGSQSDVIWIQVPKPTGDDIVIEWTAFNGIGQGVLLIDGDIVGVDTVATNTQLWGGNPGGVADEHGGGLRDITLDSSDFEFDGTVHLVRTFDGNEKSTLGIPELSISYATTDEVALDLSYNGGVLPTEFLLYRSRSRTGPWTEVKRIAPSFGSTTIYDETVDPGVSYVWAVAPRLGANEGRRVARPEGTTGPSAVTATVTTATPQKVEVQGQVVDRTPPDEARLLRSSQPGGPYDEVSKGEPTATTFNLEDTSVGAGNKFYYRIEQTSNGLSARSTEVAVDLT